MLVRKVAAGSILAAGVAAGFFGAGTASAAPGISYDPGTDGKGTIGIGDQTDKGASASASKGNTALAVSIFKPALAVALGQGNNVTAVDGSSITGKDTSYNSVTTIGGSTVVTGKASHNNILTVGGVTGVGDDSKNNTIVNAAGLVVSSKQGKAPGALSVSVCGTSLSGKVAHISVNDIGICKGKT